MRKLNVDLETLRTIYRIPMWVLSWFVNLESVEGGTLNSRLIEYPFIFKEMTQLRNGRVLDVGCTDGGNFLSPTLATLGWDVFGIDIRPWIYTHTNFQFQTGDIAEGTDFPEDFFDVVIAVSSIEHFGLAQRYGIKEQNLAADQEAVDEISRILKPDGIFLLTVPYGKGGIIQPAERIYNNETLGALISGWIIAEQTFFHLSGTGKWEEVPEEEARQTPSLAGICVSCMKLKPSPSS